MNGQTRITLLSIFSLCLLLSGCDGDELSEVRQYAKEINKRPARKIEPLPEIKKPAVATYAAENKPSPFAAPIFEQAEASHSGTALQPDFNRKREPLEAYALDALEMVGTLKMGNKMWGVIKSQDGIVHKVTSGKYIGNNFGKVIKVHKDKIDVSELLSDGKGGWQARESVIVLSD